MDEKEKLETGTPQNVAVTWGKPGPKPRRVSAGLVLTGLSIAETVFYIINTLPQGVSVFIAYNLLLLGVLVVLFLSVREYYAGEKGLMPIHVMCVFLGLHLLQTVMEHYSYILMVIPLILLLLRARGSSERDAMGTAAGAAFFLCNIVCGLAAYASILPYLSTDMSTGQALLNYLPALLINADSLMGIACICFFGRQPQQRESAAQETAVTVQEPVRSEGQMGGQSENRPQQGQAVSQDLFQSPKKPFPSPKKRKPSKGFLFFAVMFALCIPMSLAFLAMPAPEGASRAGNIVAGVGMGAINIGIVALFVYVAVKPPEFDIVFENTSIPADMLQQYEKVSIVRGVTTVTLKSCELQSPEVLRSLGKLRQLEALDLADCGITDISPLFGGHPFRKLRGVILSDNDIRDLSPISRQRTLQHLSLHYNQITDLSPLAALQRLVVLDIAGNPVQDFRGLAELPKLRGLCIEDCKVPDLSPLCKLENLEVLYISPDQAEHLGALMEKPKLMIMVQNGEKRITLKEKTAS